MNNLKPAPKSYLEMNPGTPHPKFVEYAISEMKIGSMVQTHICGALNLIEQLTEAGFYVAAFVQYNEQGNHGNGVAIIPAGYVREYKGFEIMLGGASDKENAYEWYLYKDGKYLDRIFETTGEAETFVDSLLPSPQPTSIKWLKKGHVGLCANTVYEVKKQVDGFLFIVDEFGRPQTVHNRYQGILYTEVSHAA